MDERRAIKALLQPRVTKERKQWPTWLKEELHKIAQTDNLHISPFRQDGKTYGTPTWIWSVVVDDGLYVRAYNGRSSRWRQAAMRQKAGRTTAAGIAKEVTFVLRLSARATLGQ